MIETLPRLIHPFMARLNPARTNLFLANFYDINKHNNTKHVEHQDAGDIQKKKYFLWCADFFLLFFSL